MFHLLDAENGSRVNRICFAFALVGFSATQLACVCGEDGSIVGPSNGGGTGTTPTSNSAPVANAGAAQNVAAGAVVALDASLSTDTDGDRLLYQWAFTSAPSGSAATLSDATAMKPTFTADKTGTYVLQLVVSDGRVPSEPLTVVITVAMGNSAPVANAGAVQNVTVGAVVTLDGSSSSDADGDALTFVWWFGSVPRSSAASLSDATAVKPTFTVDKEGSYVVQLIVSDGRGSSAASTVTITAATGNSAPVANAGVAQNVTAGAAIALNGSSSSDADGDPLTYSWSFLSVPSGSAASLSDATAVKPTFTVDKAGSYVVQLIVSDGEVSSAATTVTITAAAATTTTTWVPTFSALKAYLASGTDTGPDANNDFVARTAAVSVPPIKFYNPAAGQLRLYNKDGGATYAINFNGSSIWATVPFSDNGTLLTSSLDRSLSMPYARSSGPVTVRVVFTNSYAAGCSASQILLVNASGRILKAASACDAASPLSVTFTDPANTELIIAFTRVTDPSGGLRVFEIHLTK